MKKLYSLAALLAVMSVLSLRGQITDPGSKLISIDADRVALGEVMRQVELASGLLFIYKSDEVDVKRPVTLHLAETPVRTVMTEMLNGTGLTFEITPPNITLKKSPARQIAARNEQPATISRGVVTDGDGKPIVGAVVVSIPGNYGAVTDVNGRYSLDTHGDGEISVSCLGYERAFAKAPAGGGVLDFMMKDEINVMDAVVVVGYGTQKKINLTGAVSVIDGKQISDRPVNSLTHMLQGTTPGLNITTSTGRPGNSATANIRGITSINGGAPLVLIDGLEGDMSKINPADVENISVLKDASSAAVYGARASYGVILVTTKDGTKDGKVNISYNGSFGWGEPTMSTDYETRGYYSVYLNDLFFSSYASVGYTNYTEADYNQLWARRNDKTEHPDRPWVTIDRRNGKDSYVYYANTDWYHYLYKDTRPMMNHTLSLRGGNNRVRYLISGGYYQEDGIFRVNTDTYQRLNFRSKVSFEINKMLTYSANVSYYNNSYTYPGPSGVNNTFTLDKVHGLASYVPVNPDGTNVYTTIFNGYTIMDGLPAILNNGKHTNTDRNDNLILTNEITFRPMAGLSFVANYSYGFNNTRYMNRQTNVTYSKYPGVVETISTGTRFEDKLTETSDVHKYNAVNVYGTFEKTFGDGHNFKAMAGFNHETKWLKDVDAIGYYLVTTELIDLNLTGSDELDAKRTDVSGGQNQYAIMGVFARLNYDYKGRYLFEANGRYDGTSRFGSGHRFGFFPSFSLGWRISEEPFFEPARRAMDDLKVRFSYGSLGNQQVGYYDYIRKVTISSLDYLFGGTTSRPRYASLGDPNATDLTWEMVTHKNLGLDMAFLKNRLEFSSDFYIRDTKGMLVPGYSLPGVYGAGSPKMNRGDLRTKGYELSLRWRDQVKLGNRMLGYNVGVVFSDYITDITSYDNPEKLFSETYYEGMRYGDIWGYRIGGYFLSDEDAANYHVNQEAVNYIINASTGADRGLKAGDLKFLDLDGNNVIQKGLSALEPGDVEVIGNTQPRYNYGFNLGATYAGFDVSVFFQGVGRQNWYPDANAMAFWSVYARPYSTYIPKDFHKDIWSEENPNAYFPRPRGYVALQGTDRELTAINDKYLQNLAYCRLKNLTIGYTLPQKWTERIRIDKLRIYFSGENFATWTKLRSDYIDPEQASNAAVSNLNTAGSRAAIYPWQKTYSFGIDINF